jgi:ankyrin repeat protein
MIYNYNKFIMLNESVQEWNDKLLEYSRNGNLKGVKGCLKNGAEVNCKDYYNKTPLLLSSLSGHLEIVKTLIENGAEVNCKGNYGWTPLTLSSFHGHLKIIKVLIENGADWNIKNMYNRDFMYYLLNEDKETIIREYPEEYKEYLFKKDVEKYNL